MKCRCEEDAVNVLFQSIPIMRIFSDFNLVKPKIYHVRYSISLDTNRQKMLLAFNLIITSQIMMNARSYFHFRRFY